MTNTVKRNCLYLIIMGCCTYLSGYAFALTANIWFNLCVIVIAFLACTLLDFKIKLNKQLTSSKVFMICMFVAFFGSYIFNITPTGWFDYLTLILIIIFAFFLTRRVSFKDFASSYSRLMTFISLVSIIVFFLNTSGIELPGYTFQSEYSRYKTIWICTWTTNAWSTTSRVSGVFWEPGLYASLTVYALVMEAFFTGEKTRIFRTLILSLGIILSRSAAGCLLLVPVYYLMFAKGKRNKAIFDILLLICIIAVFVFSEQIISWLIDCFPEIFWKLGRDNRENITTQYTRLMSPILFIEIFLRNPVFGAGYNNAIRMYSSMMSAWQIDAWTSTSGFMLAAFGVLGISYTVFICRGVFKQKQFAILMRLLLCVIFLFIVNKEPHNANMFTYIIMFYLNEEVPGGREVEHNSETIVNA